LASLSGYDARGTDRHFFMARTLLFYTHAFSGGGAELVFARLAGAFAAAGDNVVFAADTAGPAPIADRSNLRHVVLGPNHPGSIRALTNILRTRRPDVSFSALGAQNLKHLTAASVAGRRDRGILGYHGFAAAEPRPFAQASYWLSPFTTRLAACSLCVSDVLLEDISSRWRGRRDRLRRIYNPLPDTPSGERTPDTPPLVVACGRLVPGKRFVDLVTAFATVEPRDARLAILGEGPDRGAIEAVVARLDLHDRVTLPGHVLDPSSWYRRAACLAIASESESFGLTVVEALAHGVPVVSTDCGGPPEILRDLGRIVPIGDVAALGRALTATLASPGDAAPRLARAQDFTLATIRDAYAALADRIAHQARSPSASASCQANSRVI
jgi:glycosyltransferase involved in cell wall biosynthesis